jgi:hypothetical protein
VAWLSRTFILQKYTGAFNTKNSGHNYTYLRVTQQVTILCVCVCVCVCVREREERK